MKKTAKIMMLAFSSIALLAACGQNEAESSAEEGYSLELKDQVKTWEKKTKEGVTFYYAEGVVYCKNPLVKSKQCLNIYVPEAYINEDGSLNKNGKAGKYTCETAPILYINSTGAYLGKVPYKIGDTTTIEGKSGWYYDYLQAGYVLAFSGARGRSDYGDDKVAIGKAPIGLVDLKAGIRFLKHNKASMPGNTDKIISDGMSAGGAMSTLIAVSGNTDRFDSYFQDMGAATDSTDDVYAAQIYCPIIDLEHADMAYEWYYQGDTSYDSKFTDFRSALSDKLQEKYVSYFNGLNLKVNGTSYSVESSTKNGEFVNYLLGKYSEAASTYESSGGSVSSSEKTAIKSIDTITKSLKNRSKSCPSFDDMELTNSSANAENYVFGSPTSTLSTSDDKRHFSIPVTECIESLKDAYPDEYAKYYQSYYDDSHNQEVMGQVEAFNPYTYLNENKTDIANKIRIRVGTLDSDTSPIISACLSLKLQSMGIDTDYGLVWGVGHDTADIEGGLVSWVESL